MTKTLQNSSRLPIEKAIQSLLTSNPFYVNFLLNSKISYNNSDVKTAAATVKRDGIYFYFNLEWINKCKPDEISGVIEHEILHVLFRHVFVHLEHKNIQHKVANIAMDTSINQYIDVLPEGCLSPEVLEKALGITLERFQTWEYYYSKLLDKQQELMDKNFKPHDDHLEGEFNGVEADLLRSALEQVIDKTVKDSKGVIPDHLSKVLGSSRREPTIPWKTILSNFVANSTSTFRISTRKKLSRRFGINVPGCKKKKELSLAVCIDTSGSMSDDAIQAILNEVSSLVQDTKEVYLIYADCEVQKVETLDKYTAIPTERHGNGGTAYQPAINKAMEYAPDAIIYAGDFDTSDTPQDPNVPFLWVGVGDQKPPASFGQVIRLRDL